MIPLLKVQVPPTAKDAVAAVLASGFLADGSQVRDFETWLGAYVGNPQVTAVSDISGAITLALAMAGVGSGDEVITSPMSCTATTMPIANLGARPVWGDVHPMTGMLDAEGIARLVTPRTKAVVFYHWGGDVADVDEINAVAHRHGLKTVEDAADAFGADYKHARLGAGSSDFTAYSFQAVKHITTGEGAALFCASGGDAERAQSLKRYGIHRPSFRLANGDLNEKSDIPVAGYNFYMNNIAAAIGLEQSHHVASLIARYRANGACYERALANIAGIRLLTRRPDATSAYWTYNFLAERRSDLIARLRERGVASQRLHVRNDVYSCFGGRQRVLPGVDAFDQQNVSIPAGWWVSDDDREHIIQVLREGW